MTPSGLQTLFRAYTLTTSAIQHFDFPAAGMSVRTVLQTLQDLRRERYRMAENGGCQHWWQVMPCPDSYKLTVAKSYVIVCDFVAKNYLKPAARTTMEGNMRLNFSRRLAAFPHNIVQGTFY